MTRRCLISFPLILLAPVLADGQQKKDDPAIRVASVNVVAPRPADGDDPERPGYVIVDLSIRLPSKDIVGLSRLSSKLDTFKDDKGTDLSGPASEKDSLLDNAFSQLGKDRSRAMFQLYSNTTPAPKAREFRLKANLGVLVGVGEKKAMATIAFKPGTKETIGSVELTVIGTEAEPVLLLSYTQELLKSVEFEEAGGKAIKARMTSGSGTVDKETERSRWRSQYELEKHPEKLVVRIRNYEKVEMVKVPVDLTFGLGLE
jgi:hypothetical protein